MLNILLDFPAVFSSVTSLSVSLQFEKLFIGTHAASRRQNISPLGQILPVLDVP